MLINECPGFFFSNGTIQNVSMRLCDLYLMGMIVTPSNRQRERDELIVVEKTMRKEGRLGVWTKKGEKQSKCLKSYRLNWNMLFCSTYGLGAVGGWGEESYSCMSSDAGPQPTPRLVQLTLQRVKEFWVFTLSEQNHHFVFQTSKTEQMPTFHVVRLRYELSYWGKYE